MAEYTLVLTVEPGKESWLTAVIRHLSSVTEATPGAGEILVTLRTKNREEFSLMKVVLRNLMHVRGLDECRCALATA
jgi:hypothetical protein